MTSKPDYTLYLVTDNTAGILGSRDLVSIVQDAIKGGVTVVQLRDKTSETAELILIAKQLREITKVAGVPLIINDRVDVTLAVGADGVHIGQDDMDLPTARRLLGPSAIIGVTASTPSEAVEAAEGGANYLGVGTIYATPTKENAKHIIGIAGARDILSAVARSSNPAIPVVFIGGVNEGNIQRVIYQTTAPEKGPSGVAVVSAIMAAPDPQRSAAHLLHLVKTPPPFLPSSSSSSSNPPPHPQPTHPLTPSTLHLTIPSLLRLVSTQKPLCHNITNTVVQNLAANIALSLGGSPIMSQNSSEARDLASLGGSLVLNMGTITADALAHYRVTAQAYNAAGGPVVYDPVGAGATGARKAAVKMLMNSCYFDVIKGNESEIQTVLGQRTDITQHGVDSSSSSTSSLSEREKATIVKTLAARERNIALMTGATDFLSDGTRTLAVRNGHRYLGLITGSGCTLGTTVAAFAAVERSDKLLAVVAAVVVFELAAEMAAARPDVKGPGTFVPAFIDSLHALREMAERGEEEYFRNLRVEFVDV